MTQAEKFYGNYLGIVIQNNDPEKRGRVKIFVPHVSYGLYRNWDKIETDKVFTNLGDPDLNDIIDQLKDVLPWAEVAGPLFGGNASGRYNSVTKKVYTTNTNVWTQEEPLQGNRPAAAFTGIGSLHDGFNDAGKTGIINPYSFEYTPSDYSNLAAGSFTIPNVGAHVWVFYQGGDHDCPVYWATSYSQADYKRIYTTVKFTDKTLAQLGEESLLKADASVDYPGEYENSANPTLTTESKTFRAKHVINTNKHTIELIDTDNREILKLTHFSGSFKEWNNYSTIEFSANNDQKMVLGDQFETVRKSKNIYVTGNNRLFTSGDSYIRVGNYDINKVTQVVSTIKNINEYKQLFDGKRTGRFIYARRDGVIPLIALRGVNAMSSHQTQQPQTPGLAFYSEANYYNGFVQCPVCENKEYVPNPDGWTLGQTFQSVEGSVNPTYTTGEIDSRASGLFSTLEGLQTTKAFPETEEGIGYFLGAECDICNSKWLNPADLRRVGFSPSTEQGLFASETLKLPGNEGLYQYYNNNRRQLNELLATFSGGDQIIEVHKNKIETVGLVMNDSMSFRIDPVGKLRVESVFVAPEGLYPSGKPSPHIESVDVAEVPGGNYILTAANKLKFVVGAKGINIKTFGPLDMYGGIVNFAGEQLNISSQNEINIDAGEKLLIRGRKVTFVSKDHEPVLIESPLHVSRNTIIGGGLYIDGEVGLRHISTLREIGVTTGPTAANAAPPPLVPGESFTFEFGNDNGDEFYANQLADRINSFGGTAEAVATYENGQEIWSTQYTLPLDGLSLDLLAAINPGLPGVSTGEEAGSTPDLAGIVSAIAMLAAQVAFLLSHVHLYDRIPTTFFDSVEDMRNYMYGVNINGRNATAAARPTTPFTGIWSGLVTTALKSKNFTTRVGEKLTTLYAAQYGALIPPVLVADYGAFYISPGGADFAPSGSNLKAQVRQNYQLSTGSTITYIYDVDIPVEPAESQDVNETTTDTIETVQSYQYTGGSITVTKNSTLKSPLTTPEVEVPEFTL